MVMIFGSWKVEKIIQVFKQRLKRLQTECDTDLDFTITASQRITYALHLTFYSTSYCILVRGELHLHRTMFCFRATAKWIKLSSRLACLHPRRDERCTAVFMQRTQLHQNTLLRIGTIPCQKQWSVFKDRKWKWMAWIKYILLCAPCIH